MGEDGHWEPDIFACYPMDEVTRATLLAGGSVLTTMIMTEILKTYISNVGRGHKRQSVQVVLGDGREHGDEKHVEEHEVTYTEEERMEMIKTICGSAKIREDWEELANRWIEEHACGESSADQRTTALSLIDKIFDEPDYKTKPRQKTLSAEEKEKREEARRLKE